MSPSCQRRRWARWGAVALLTGVTVVDAARHDWPGAGASAALAAMFGLLPTVLTPTVTTAQRISYFIIVIAGLVF